MSDTGGSSERTLTIHFTDVEGSTQIRTVRGDAVANTLLRKLPVVEKDRPIGIVSLGDLAQKHDPKSALADISSAPANN